VVVVQVHLEVVLMYKEISLQRYTYNSILERWSQSPENALRSSTLRVELILRRIKVV